MRIAITSRRLRIGAFLTVLFVTLLVLWSPWKKGPDELAAVFREALGRAGWRDIYATMSPQEVERGQWNEEQFVLLMDNVIDGKEELLAYPVEIRKLPSRNSFEQVYVVEFKLRDNRSFEKGRYPIWNLVAMRGEDRWYLQLDTLPLFINRLSGGTRTERLTRLADAIEASGRSNLVDFRSGATLSPDKLRAAAYSEPTGSSAWVRRL